MSDNPPAPHRPVLLATTIAHASQDGMVAIHYVLLPLLSITLGLSYTQVGILKAAASVAMSCLEIPSGLMARRFGERRLIIAGLLGGAAGYFGLSLAGGFYAALLFILLTGCGAAFQHALSSSLLVRHFASGERRRALGTYNASGDVGKLLYTGLFSALIGAGISWNHIALLIAAVALIAAMAIFWLLKRTAQESEQAPATEQHGGWGITHKGRFAGVLTTVLLDSIVQAGFLTFIALILMDKGMSAGSAAFGVVLTLAGGPAVNLPVVIWLPASVTESRFS